MMLIGLAGIFLPPIMSVAVVTFMSWMFIFSAFVQGYNTWKNYRKSFVAWLKPVLSFAVGILFLLFPIQGVAVVGILLATYLLIDAYSSIAFGFEYKPNRGWWMMILNGIFSIILAIILLMGWPFSSIVLVGLFVGVSLFFDGVALLTFAIGAKKISNDSNEEKNKE
jgi:uncharacterized membrane protein HdeD (DUF308 family)